MVVLNVEEVVGGKLFKCLLCLDGLGAGSACHEMCVAEAGEVVDKDCDSLVSLCCQLALELGDKTWLRGDKLVHGYNLAWSGCHKNLLY